jgi:hypothetical protein
MKSVVVPIPVEADIDAMVRESAEATGLKLADVMRQGLRHGVPAFVARLRTGSVQRQPACLAYLDRYPESKIAAKDYKVALKAKLAKKYDRPNR